VTVSIRRIESGDAPRWHAMWDAYVRFNGHDPSEIPTRYTWARILDPTSAIGAIVAERDNGGVIAFANYTLHDNTWTSTPVCCLDDLFVDADSRAEGVGRMLIDWLIAEMQAKGWSRLYWITRETNYRARALYDSYTTHSGFLRYVVVNAELKRSSL
jgi:GNAT superfamily N-acetyltransferase